MQKEYYVELHFDFVNKRQQDIYHYNGIDFVKRAKQLKAFAENNFNLEYLEHQASFIYAEEYSLQEIKKLKEAYIEVYSYNSKDDIYITENIIKINK